MMLKNKTLTLDDKEKMLDIIVSVLAPIQEDAKTNTDKLQEENRYYNWYQGCTKFTMAELHNSGVYFSIVSSASPIKRLRLFNTIIKASTISWR